jgi:hypothetical protein
VLFFVLVEISYADRTKNRHPTDMTGNYPTKLKENQVPDFDGLAGKTSEFEFAANFDCFGGNRLTNFGPCGR